MFKQTQQKLIDLGFQITLDEISFYSQNADLYYLEVANKELFAVQTSIPIDKCRRYKCFFVANHFNKNHKNSNTQGVDLWAALYHNKKDIGQIEPVFFDCIQLGFDVDTDKQIIDFMENKTPEQLKRKRVVG